MEVLIERIPNLKKSAFIIVTHNNVELLTRCVNSIIKYSSSPYHIFLIDNASSDATTGFCLHNNENLTYIRNNKNLWWGGGINQGIKLSDAYDYVFFLNDDIEVYKDWDINHINVLESVSNIGAVGPMNSNPDDWQNYDRVIKVFNPNIPELKDVERSNIEEINRNIRSNERTFITVRGMLAFFCTAFKRSVIDKVGLLDEDFIMGGDDDDYARRLDLEGLNLALLLNTYVIHHGSTSTKKNKSDSWKLSQRKKNSELLKKKYPNYYVKH